MCVCVSCVCVRVRVRVRVRVCVCLCACASCLPVCDRGHALAPEVRGNSHTFIWICLFCPANVVERMAPLKALPAHLRHGRSMGKLEVDAQVSDQLVT